MSLPIRILIIEDVERQVEALEEACDGVGVQVAIAIAPTVERAQELLEDDEYDLVVCDLALPLSERTERAERDRGMALFRQIRERHPGVPLVVLTGEGDTRLMPEFFAASRDEDLFGTGERVPMVHFFDKLDFADCRSVLETYLRGLGDVASIPYGADGLDLPASHRRVLQLLARRAGGARFDAESMQGGLSKATAIRMDVRGADDQPRGVLAVKLGPVERVTREKSHWDRIASLLPVGLGPQVVHVVVAGAGDAGGIAYKHAEDHGRTFFECVRDSPDVAEGVVQRLHERFRPWYEDAPTVPASIASLRRRQVSDAALQRLGTPLPTFDSLGGKMIEVSQGLQHCDFHGENVLVDAKGEPALIDFADVAEAQCSLDPITLELSLIFHPSEAAQEARGAWPSEAAIANWHDLPDFLEDCPYGDVVRACRAWTIEAAVGEPEIIATALAYALRQLQYKNPTEPLARRLAQETAARLAAS